MALVSALRSAAHRVGLGAKNTEDGIAAVSGILTEVHRGVKTTVDALQGIKTTNEALKINNLLLTQVLTRLDKLEGNSQDKGNTGKEVSDG